VTGVVALTFDDGPDPMVAEVGRREIETRR